jgi:hypothetical protein
MSFQTAVYRWVRSRCKSCDNFSERLREILAEGVIVTHDWLDQLGIAHEADCVIEARDIAVTLKQLNGSASGSRVIRKWM